jgi:acetyl esterase/lipase
MIIPGLLHSGRRALLGGSLSAVFGILGCQGGDVGPSAEHGPPARVVVVAGDQQSGPVGQALGESVVAHVTDEAGRAVPDAVVAFNPVGDAGSFTPATGRTDVEGKARAIWTLSTRAGNLSARAAVEGATPAIVTATATPAAAERLAFIAEPTSGIAGVVLSPPVVVAIEDSYGNVVPTSGEVHLELNHGSLNGVLDGQAVEGTASFVDLHVDEAGNGYVLTATADGLIPAVTNAFSIGSGTATRLRIVAGDGQQAPVGTVVPTAPTVVVRDAAGNGVAGASVAFTVVEGGGMVTATGAVTGSDGRAAVDWTMGPVAGPNRIRVTAAAVPGSSVEFVSEGTPGPADPARSSLSAEPLSVPVGTSSAVTVRARDAFDNPVPGKAVHLTVAGSGTTVVQPSVTDASGTASGSVRSSTAGSLTVSAEIDGAPLDRQATILVVRIPVATTVQVTPEAAALLVGQTTRLSATVLDDLGETMQGATVTWASGDAAIAAVDANGNVSARGPGSVTISANSGGVTGRAQITVSFGEGTLTGLTYCTIDGTADKMDVYVPAASKPRPLPVVVHVHGGGWVSGTRSSGERFAQVKQTLLDRGYLVVSLDYRLAPTHKYPAQIQDVKCAIRHLRARASRYGLDPSRIGAWGGSAGGQLVALLGTADAGAGFDDVGGFLDASSRVQAVVAISAITDFTHPDELHDNYSRAFLTWPDPTSPEMIDASPVTHVTADDSPFFFIVGEDDALVSNQQSARMNQRLQEVGVPSSVLTVLNADHDLEPTDQPTDPSAAVIVSRISGFFDQTLR